MRQYQQGNILQTWKISYDEIQKRDPNAAKLLLLLARYDNQDIWYELIKNAFESSNVPTWPESTMSTPLTFKVTMKNLLGFSLLESRRKQGGSYTMHPVVQDWCIHLASTDKSVNSIQLDEVALISVGYAIPRSWERNDFELQQRLLPRANYVRHRKFSGDNIIVWEAFHGLGNPYQDQGKPKEAE